STTFTYTAASPGLAASGGGTATLSCNGAACPSGEALLVVAKGLTGSDTDADASSEPSFLPDPGPGIAAASESGTTVTVTTSAPHGFTSGDTVQVQGVSVPGYNGTFNNISVTDATTFTYTAASGLATPASGGTVNDLTGSDDLLIDVCTGTTPTTTESSCALLVDRATGAVLARYPVSGTTTLQALTLDPLVRDCSGANETCSTSVPTVSNFWLGDNSFPNFYKLDFATGT